MNLTDCPPRDPGLIPSPGEVFLRIFSWLITLCQFSSWASVTKNGSISSQWHRTTCGHRGGRLKSNHGQTAAERNKAFFGRKNCELNHGNHVKEKQNYQGNLFEDRPIRRQAFIIGRDSARSLRGSTHTAAGVYHWPWFSKVSSRLTGHV